MNSNNENTTEKEVPPEDVNVAQFRAAQSIVTALIRALHESDVLPQEKVFTSILKAATSAESDGKTIQAALMKKYVARIRAAHSDS